MLNCYSIVDQANPIFEGLFSSVIVSVEIQRPSVMLLQGCSIEHSLGIWTKL
jgi:hypothetical protein